MEKLEFPISKKTLPRGKVLDMDDYLKFVTENLKLIDLKKLRKWKRQGSVGVSFTLK